MFELRPGLIGWSLLNWAFAAKGNFNTASVFVAALEATYVLDGLFIEAGNLTMMDIVHDGFGFMLCFGDLAWVPFLYTLKAKYLAYHYTTARIDNTYLMLCLGLHVVGYIIFRGANSQKDAFRKNPRDPNLRYLKSMRTSSGSSLIISGFWGICRHPNYVGDWLMTTAWCALTGTNVAVTYFQSIYFAILLIHRQLRDEHQMRIKYGDADWKTYCTHVPYRLIPYVY
jgi:delta14-sterol reductase